MTRFHLSGNPAYTIFDSMADSVRFTVERTLLRGERTIWSKSSFVDEQGEAMTWHDFGTLEGPGWAANAVGGAYEIHWFGRYTKQPELCDIALGILDHVLRDGFLDENGLIFPYRDLATGQYCLNFKHNDDWLCPGSMAKVGYQLLVFSDFVDEERQRVMRTAAAKAARWISDHAPLADNGWLARRCTREGLPYPAGAEGGDDLVFATSGDGLFSVMLMTELTARGLADYHDRVRDRLKQWMCLGGLFGSINHDTYDQQESVSYVVAFRTLLRAARLLDDEEMRRFAYGVCLAGLERFKLREDRNGCATAGLLYMEDSWDTCYLWENAEAALAYFEAYEDSGEHRYLDDGLTILRAIAKHHHGPDGFLTEGVDWNNHVGAQHHFEGAEFGDIRYTEPFLNHLHIVEPTLFHLERMGPKVARVDG